MSGHAIGSRQLRALVLLLALVPLIPTVLMLRLMIEGVRTERDAARERIENLYQRALLGAAASAVGHAAFRSTKDDTATAAALEEFFQRLLDEDVSVRIADAQGNTLAGPPRGKDTPVARCTLNAPLPPWEVELYLTGTSLLREGVEEHVKVYAWTAGVAILAVVLIAGSAGWAVSRQLKLHELRNTVLSTVAHELKTPVASIRLLIDTLREGRYRDARQLREYFELVSRENLRLGRVIQNFLTFSRIERRKYPCSLRVASPREMVEPAVEALSVRFAEEGCDFTLELDDGLPPVRADADAMVTALVNLLDNALKFSNGTKEVTLRARQEGERVLFEVSDNGIGLSRAEARCVFRRFYQADCRLSRRREGAGLGLSIVKAIVEAHHGTVSFESETGKGSKFTIGLPVAGAVRA